MALIPDGFAVIPGSGRKVAQAIVKALDGTDATHDDITYSPTVGFVVPEGVAKKYKAPKIEDGEAIDDNSTASKVDTLSPAKTELTTASKADEPAPKSTKSDSK